ncbi:MAG: hypothetical protein M3290_13660 [Actinomycetota bacterium]|nr:hypothetical protein [Actinomycetota bacterium]
MIEEFESAVQRDDRLRRALSCCDFDDAVPLEIRDRLYSYIRPEDDIGRGV